MSQTVSVVPRVKHLGLGMGAEIQGHGQRRPSSNNSVSARLIGQMTWTRGSLDTAEHRDEERRERRSWVVHK